jgi:uncharacterized integral membrane protein
VVASLVLLVVLIVFIAENTQHSTVAFFGLHGSAPVAVLLLIAAVAGALIVVVVGAARLLQLRLSARRASTDGGPSVGPTGAAPPVADTTTGPNTTAGVEPTTEGPASGDPQPRVGPAPQVGRVR